MNEAETRAELIDPALNAAGWGVVEGSRVRREYMIAPGRIEGHGRRVISEYAADSKEVRKQLQRILLTQVSIDTIVLPWTEPSIA